MLLGNSKLAYAGYTFHRIIPRYMIQGRDFLTTMERVVCRWPSVLSMANEGELLMDRKDRGPWERQCSTKEEGF